MDNFETNDISPESQESENTSLMSLIYLVPVLGVFPSLWAVYNGTLKREQLATCRLSITMALTWLLAYILLATGANQTASITPSFLALRLLILNTFLTSGYFIVSIWLIIQTLRGKSIRLKSLSHFASQIFSKYLP